MNVNVSRRFACGAFFNLFLFYSHRASALNPDKLLSKNDVARARAYAEDLVSTLDRYPLNKSEYDLFYEDSGAALKNRYSAEQYYTRLNKVRGPLGRIIERRFYGFSGAFDTLPNIIGGEYVIVAFRTIFGGDPTIHTEQITLERDRFGHDSWRFVEYYVASLGPAEK